jgi:hypothetical protein
MSDFSGLNRSHEVSGIICDPSSTWESAMKSGMQDFIANNPSEKILEEALACSLGELWRQLKAKSLPTLSNPSGWFWKLCCWRLFNIIEKTSVIRANVLYLKL